MRVLEPASEPGESGQVSATFAGLPILALQSAHTANAAANSAPNPDSERGMYHAPICIGRSSTTKLKVRQWQMR